MRSNKLAMLENKFLCKKQIFQEFGISKSTFYRLVKILGLHIERRLLSPTEAENLRNVLRGMDVQAKGKEKN